jgi:hypothetical protein
VPTRASQNEKAGIKNLCSIPAGVVPVNATTVICNFTGHKQGTEESKRVASK